MEAKLGNEPYTSVRVLCGKQFFRKLIAHPSVIGVSSPGSSSVEDTSGSPSSASRARGTISSMPCSHSKARTIS